MENPRTSIKLRWFDESILLESDRITLTEAFLESIGITSPVATDIFEVLLISAAKDTPLKTSEIRAAVISLRAQRKIKSIEKGLTDRNIQIWLKYFSDIGLIEQHFGKYRFSIRNNPSESMKKTKQIIEESYKMSVEILKKAEQQYKIK